MKLSEDTVPKDQGSLHQAESDFGLDAASRALLRRQMGQLSPEEMSIEQARLQMRDGQAVTLADPSLLVETLTCGNSTIELVRRRDLTGLAPVVFFLHGGGWVMGDIQTHGYLIASLALRSRCAIAFVNYPLAPEVTYPQSLDEALLAIRELLAQSTRLQLDKDRFAFAGDSAGGNMAASLTLLCKHRALPLPQVQILLYPALDIRSNSSTYQAHAHGLNLTRRTMRWFWNQYAPGMEASVDPQVSPILAPETLLVGLPQTLVVTCEFDVLRDEGEFFAKRLQQAGVNASTVRFGGVLHGFMVTESLAKSPSGELAIRLVSDYLRNNLALEP